MQPEDYPEQEPFSAPASAYHDEVMRRGAAIAGQELSYGPDPYQRVLVCPAPRPAGAILAVIHGGGWTNGYKEWMAFMAPAFTAEGVTFASIGYRLAPRHLFPAGFDDVRAGLAALAGAASQFGFDGGGIFIGGHSAGGHLAALIALSAPPGTIRGCLPISGVYDFGPGSGLTMRPRFLGPADAGVDAAASPIARVSGQPPPFLLAHGSDDFPHLVTQAERMERVLREARGEVVRVVLAGRNHFTASYAGGEPDGPWVPLALTFMQEH